MEAEPDYGPQAESTISDEGLEAVISGSGYTLPTAHK